jgi:peroxiredoxin|tara:strand:+ start:682 stop:1260 length:579 start_codon:yes stop_codon:yes gene_type:complete
VNQKLFKIFKIKNIMIEGKKVPNVVFKTRVINESIGGENPFIWKDVSSDEIFKGKRVVVFALPGAFTPTCSSRHLPGYETYYNEIKEQGVDEVYCLSVNDAFVMHQWGKHQGAEKIKLLPDGNGEFTRKMGMLVKKEDLGFGDRSWRYSMVVNNGVIEKIFIESGFEDNCPTDPFEVSDAKTTLNYLKEKKE